jgi:hypothetical protein
MPTAHWVNTVERLRREYVRVEDSSCWTWTGSIARNGYSKARINNRHVSGHRAFYEHYVGPIGPMLTLDHVCRNKRCVNPAHLEAVTSRENTMRAENSLARINADKTWCDSGHPLEGENLYVTPDGRRQCRTCRREASARSYQRRRSCQ